MRRLAKFFLAVLLAAGLAGCANSIGATKLDAIPDELAAVADPLDSRPAVAWDHEGDAWLILTFGSSSCPSEPRAITQNADGSFEITLEQSGGPACTADFGPAAYRVAAPVSKGAPVTVDLGPGTRVTLEG